ATACDSRAMPASKPRFNGMGNGRTALYVPAQDRLRSHFIDVLPARAAGTGKRPLELAERNFDEAIDFQHRSFRPAVLRTHSHQHPVKWVVRIKMMSAKWP